MKQVRLFAAAAFMLIALCFSACSDDTTTGNNNSSSTPTPGFGDADGVLAAIQTLSFQNVAGFPVTITVDVALASFFATGSTSSFLDAGTVTVNTNAVDILSNNSYVSTSGTTDLGYSPGSTVAWSVAGSADVTAFNHTTTKTMIGEFNLNGTYTTIDIDADVTVNISTTPANADSILWNLIDGDGNIVSKTTVPGTSVTFTAAEISGLNKGSNGILQVAAYNFESASYGGKKIYFINESVVSEIATLD